MAVTILSMFVNLRVHAKGVGNSLGVKLFRRLTTQWSASYRPSFTTQFIRDWAFGTGLHSVSACSLILQNEGAPTCRVC